MIVTSVDKGTYQIVLERGDAVVVVAPGGVSCTSATTYNMRGVFVMERPAAIEVTEPRS